MPNAPLEDWQGQFGDEYTERNAQAPLTPRIKLWREILAHAGAEPASILEVGANIGQNLVALKQIFNGVDRPAMVAVEPNARAREVLQLEGIKAYAGHAGELDFAPDSFDLVFTSGVLIHISPVGERGVPSDLHRACAEIVRVSKKWVVAIEYFSAQPREIIYRERRGLLWARDFGQFYVDEFGLEPVACGFAWKTLTGLDNLTWWVLRKPPAA
jgi:pseudaminic acid biosynthesis-associated methylase